MSSSQPQSDDTETYSNSSLNNARITSPSEVQSTPSTRHFKKKAHKKSIRYDSSDDDDEEWRMLLTNSIEEAAAQRTPPRTEIMTASLKKHLQKTAEITNKQGCKYDSMCPICLTRYNTTRGSLPCLHEFCFECIQEWCKTSTICPCCRAPFPHILKTVLREGEGGGIVQTEKVEVEARELVLLSEYDHYTCYQCGLGDNQHVLLICDGCDFYCCHVYCDPALHHRIPNGDWFCLYCRDNLHQQSSELAEVVSDEESPEKAVAHRTRSREESYNLRSHLSALRSLRRRR